MEPLDDPARMPAVRARIAGKPCLRHYYRQIYRRYAECLGRCPDTGFALELGSGAGFAKDVIPGIITSDVLAHDGVDQTVDATALPFDDGSLRFIGMTNVFHHIADAPAFLGEAQRCLMPGGRLFIVDQHVGPISMPFLSLLHHEPFDRKAAEWGFAATGPLSGANGALPWIVFRRDRPRLDQQFPGLKLRRYQPHSPLFYWLSGGLKSWTLIPETLIPVADALDRMLIRISPELGSFVDIELERLDPTPGGSGPKPEESR